MSKGYLERPRKPRGLAGAWSVDSAEPVRNCEQRRRLGVGGRVLCLPRPRRSLGFWQVCEGTDSLVHVPHCSPPEGLAAGQGLSCDREHFPLLLLYQWASTFGWLKSVVFRDWPPGERWKVPVFPLSDMCLLPASLLREDPLCIPHPLGHTGHLGIWCQCHCRHRLGGA